MGRVLIHFGNTALGVAKINVGSKPFDVILMLKTLLIQSIYKLSDDSMEDQINDRLSFMRFLKLTPGAKVPDTKTI